MPDVHAKLSPSSAHRWMKCPGSIREGSKYPSGGSSDAAIDGTHTHTLLEHCINGGGDPLKMVGVVLTDNEGQFAVDKDRASRVASALDYINARAKLVSAKEIKSEQRVNPGQLLMRDDFFGTADVQLIADDFIEIIDYKDGHMPVAPDSPQLKIYAIGAVTELVKNNHFIKDVRLTIIQPKLGEPKSFDTTYEELFNWFTTEVRSAIAAIDDPNAPLVAGKHCRYCNAAGNCPQQAQTALEGAQIMFQHIELAEQSANQNPSELSDDKIREVLEAAPVIQQFLKDVQSEAFKRFEAGKPITGMKMVYSGKGNREWSMGEDEVVTHLSKLGIPKAQIYQKKLLSPSQAEKLTWTGKSKGEEVVKQLTDRKIKKMNEEMVTKGKGNKMIVPESDPRDSIHTDAQSMFAEVEVQQPQEPAALPAWLS